MEITLTLRALSAMLMQEYGIVSLYQARKEAFKMTSDISVLDASGFVSLSDVLPNILLDIRYYSTFNFVGERIDGYTTPRALITREAALSLGRAATAAAQKGYLLKVFDTYRPQAAVDHFVRWAKDLSDTRMKPYFYPEVDKACLFEQGYIAARSGHSRGSTVDLTLFDRLEGRDVDMGGPFDYFGERSHPAYTQGLTSRQLAARQLLRDIMLSQGFRPLSTEWWHFTLQNEPYPDTYFAFPV